MDLKKTVDFLRNLKAWPDQIYLILALIEIDAITTPIFSGIKEDEVIRQLYHLLNSLEAQYNIDENYKYRSSRAITDFFQYLSWSKEFSFDLDKLRMVYSEIKKKGESQYEFTKINRVGES